nr:DEAD/DEAH box helicase [Propionibacterium sp.]
MAAAARRPHSFYDLGVRPVLAEALAARGIVEPFPIQAASLPDSLAGRDVLGRGRTGSGKTVAFALPLLERVLAVPGRREPGRPRALVLVPTRELAVQVHETVEFLAQALKVKTMTVYGGVRYTGQLRRLERGVDVVVATPGRLEDLIEQGALSLDAVAVVVLDEADLMADMGFLPPVTRILERTPPGQRMLFSATLDADVARLVETFLNDPLVHEVDEAGGTVDAQHHLFLVRHDNKPAVVRELLTGGGRALAFTRTKFAAERLARTLTEAGVPAVDLHGNLRQGARQRHLAAFADGTVAVLVATDIAARGLHVDDIGLVVHVDPPNDPKAFLHRSGRTARAGSAGTVVTLATKNQNKAVRHLMGQAGIKPAQRVVAPGDAILTEVRAARVEPAASGTSIFEPDPEDVAEEDAAPRPVARPRREPRGHPPGRHATRPERGEPRPRPGRARTDQGRTDQGRTDRNRPEERAFTAAWWGPEPWETDGGPAPVARREDRRPRPGRADRAVGRAQRPERDPRAEASAPRRSTTPRPIGKAGKRPTNSKDKGKPKRWAR